MEKTSHIQILGKTTCPITGETLVDTLDERLRIKTALFLFNEKGYLKSDIFPRRKISFELDGKVHEINVDFSIKKGADTLMVVRFGPGSLVTRERPALAVSRLVSDYEVPVSVITNGEDATLLETKTGKTIGKGFESIPHKKDLLELWERALQRKISEKQKDLERRILVAYEVNGACNCDC